MLNVVCSIGTSFDIPFRITFVAPSLRSFTVPLSTSLNGPCGIPLSTSLGVTFEISVVTTLSMTCIISFAPPLNAPLGSPSGPLFGKVLCLDTDRLPSPKDE